MTKRIKETGLPADAEVYRFSRGYKYIIVAGVVFFGAFLGLTLSLPFWEPKGSNAFVMVFCSLVFGPFFIYSVLVLKRMEDVVAANDTGIWYISRRNHLFLSWREIVSVKARDRMQRITVSDVSGRAINIEYQLENFENLRNLILRQVPRRENYHGKTKVFRQSYLNIIIFPIGAVFFAVLALLACRDGAVIPSWLFLGFVLLAVIGLMFLPLKLIIGDQCIQIRYPVYQKIVPFTNISDVVLRNQRERGNEVATVIITLITGKPIKLAGYRGGSISLFDSIQAAWKDFLILDGRGT